MQYQGLPVIITDNPVRIHPANAAELCPAMIAKLIGKTRSVAATINGPEPDALVLTREQARALNLVD